MYHNTSKIKNKGENLKQQDLAQTKGKKVLFSKELSS
jgi:hypothetical protein